MKKREIFRAQTMGFCMGVRRAVRIAEKVLERPNKTKKPVYTLGPLIHNRLVIEDLQQKGIRQVSGTEQVEGGTVILRAHGVIPDIKNMLAAKAVDIVDATCPKVVRSQEKVREYSKKGYTIIIVGDPDHGEVRGLAGYARNSIIIRSIEEARKIEMPDKIMVIGQTTIDANRYKDIAALLEERGKNVEIIDSICGSVAQRQKALRRLAEKVDAILILGGKNSANTKNLYNTAVSLIDNVWHIESAEEIPEEILQYRKIGISAGASTPDWLIDEVERKLSAI